tara:strand:+ start:24 stop:242 length:219 start_codon:yes stop_codon:yes gene_type:complete
MFNWLRKLINVGVEAEPTGVRARNAKGHFVKDDKSTPNVNEAYADGKTPKRKPRKKPAAKKRGRPKGSKNKK